MPRQSRQDVGLGLDELREQLKGNSLHDVYVVGFLYPNERYGQQEFHAMWATVYLECRDFLLQLRAVRTTGTMSVRVVPAFEPEDWEDPVAFASVSEQFLWNVEGENPFVALRLWQSPGEEYFCAAQFDLRNGQELFVDPTYYYGIVLGGTEQKRIWRENWPPAERAQEHVLQLAADPSTGSRPAR